VYSSLPDPSITPTPVYRTNPYPPGIGNLVLEDPLTDNSRGYQWDTGFYTDGGSCNFASGVYQIGETETNHVQTCNAEGPKQFTNFTFEVKMRIMQGTQGGIAFRQDSMGGSYEFLIDTNGSWVFDIQYDGQSSLTTLKSGTAQNFHPGYGQWNTLAVVARQNQIDLYANYDTVATFSDNVHSSGLIGLCASADVNQTNVDYSNAFVWSL
jgi:hypothetical protein